MPHDILNAFSSYDAGTLKLLHRAFDEVWKDIAGDYGVVETIDERRTRLALIILDLANIGERDLDEIKSDALALMRLREPRRQSRH